VISCVFIYALLDPDSGRVRYIGKSCKPAARLRGHIQKLENSPLGEWIAFLKAGGKRPKLEILEEVSELEWPVIEMGYIRVFRMIWPDLLNRTVGVPKKMTSNRIKCPKWTIK